MTKKTNYVALRDMTLFAEIQSLSFDWFMVLFRSGLVLPGGSNVVDLSNICFSFCVIIFFSIDIAVYELYSHHNGR